MKKVISAAALALAYATSAHAEVTLNFDGGFGSLYRTVRCPISMDDCSDYISVEDISVPQAGALSFNLSAGPLTYHEFNWIEDGRPVTIYSSGQQMGWTPRTSSAFDHALATPSSLTLANPIDEAQWSSSLESGSVYQESSGAYLSRRLYVYTDTNEVFRSRSFWTVGFDQNWYFNSPTGSIQYLNEVRLWASVDLELTPTNVAESFTESSFMKLMNDSLACEYCLDLSGNSSVYGLEPDSYSDNSYYGLARLTAVGAPAAPVPEPSVFALMLLGLIGVGCHVRTRGRWL